MTQVPQAALDLVMHYESWRGDAYPDPATGGAPWTMGFGFTQGVFKGDSISYADSVRVLGTLLGTLADQITGALQVEADPNQLSAFLSFAYNEGFGALNSSTLFRLFNAGDTAGAAAEFDKWDKAAGKTMKGLQRRRRAESLVFQGSSVPDAIQAAEGAFP